MNVIVLKLSAQDPHYSQYFNSPIYENPANTGFSDAMTRIVLNYRNQWRAVSEPFKTFSASIDGISPKSMFKSRKFGYGILMMRDKAGDSEFGFASAALSFSYSQSLTKRKNQWITGGVQIAYVQKSFNYTSLRFGDQFNGVQYDAGHVTDEYFPKEQFSYPDINAGINWKYRFNNKQIYSAGFAVHHLNRPDQSFFEEAKIPLKIKYTFNAGMKLILNEITYLSPLVATHIQGSNREFLAGVQYTYEHRESSLPADFSGGLINRFNDALILIAGIKFHQINLNISYDLNYSKLRTSSDLRGGPEFSLVILFGNTNFPISRQVSCPIF